MSQVNKLQHRENIFGGFIIYEPKPFKATNRRSIWKVDQFLGNVLYWLVVVVFDDHAKEFNIICCNGAFLGW